MNLADFHIAFSILGYNTVNEFFDTAQISSLVFVNTLLFCEGGEGRPNVGSEVSTDSNEWTPEIIVPVRSNRKTICFIPKKLINQIRLWQLGLPASLKCESHFLHEDESLLV